MGNTSICSKCDPGWTGKLCDIPKDRQSSQHKSGKIEEDEELDQIFKARRINDETARGYDDPVDGSYHPRTGTNSKKDENHDTTGGSHPGFFGSFSSLGKDASSEK